MFDVYFFFYIKKLNKENHEKLKQYELLFSCWQNYFEILIFYLIDQKEYFFFKFRLSIYVCVKGLSLVSFCIKLVCDIP